MIDGVGIISSIRTTGPRGLSSPCVYLFPEERLELSMYVRITRGQNDPAKVDETIDLVPDISDAIRSLPGCQGVQIAIDRTTGKSVSISTFDTQTHAQFSRETLGEPLARLVATGWQPEPPEFYEVVE